MPGARETGHHRLRPVNTKRKVRQELDHIHEFPLGRNTLVPGTEVSIKGKRGRFRFQYARPMPIRDFELTFVGGPLHGQRDRFISVLPEQITRVHRVNRTLVNIQRAKKGMQ